MEDEERGKLEDGDAFDDNVADGPTRQRALRKPTPADPKLAKLLVPQAAHHILDCSVKGVFGGACREGFAGSARLLAGFE